MRLPDFAIIGAQKSATTFLHGCLAEHPEVYMPRAEIPFFESPDYERSKISDLAGLFAGRSEKWLGFKRPNFLGKPELVVLSRLLGNNELHVSFELTESLYELYAGDLGVLETFLGQNLSRWKL